MKKLVDDGCKFLLVAALQDHSCKRRTSFTPGGALVGDELVDRRQFLPDQPEERVDPEEYKGQLQEYFIKTVFFFDVHQLMLEDS